MAKMNGTSVYWSSPGIDNVAFVDDNDNNTNSIPLEERVATPITNGSIKCRDNSVDLTASKISEAENGTAGDIAKGQDPPPPDRAQWNSSVEFLLSCIAMSVGIGNFYRFPFVAYQNGGGAFLLPYIIVLLVIGKPMYYLELAIGQFCSYGQVKCWEMSPFFKGVGFGSTLCSFCVVTYYCSVMALTVFYLGASCQATLPWSECDPSWAGNETCNILLNATVENTTRINLAQLYFE